MAQVTLQVQGLDCAEEVALLRNQLQPIPGVYELSFDILSGRATVEFDESKIDTPLLISEVRKTGLEAREYVQRGHLPLTADPPVRGTRFDLCLMSGLSGFLGLVFETELHRRSGTDASAIHWMSMASNVSFLLSAISGLWLVLPKAWLAVRRMQPDMNLLMTIAAVGAFSIGEPSEAAAVAFLFSLSLLLESRSIDRARNSIDALMVLAPSMANRLNLDGSEQQLPASQVEIGSVVRVRPGDRFPLDGQVIAGETTVDQSPITGESVPTPKSNGSQVFAGTINRDGLVEVRTTQRADDSVLAHILRLVTEARQNRSSAEQSVETFARYYTPIVMLLSILVISVPPLLFHGSPGHWFYQGLVLLVIACPCALVISTPVSVVAALTSTARQGVLVKGGRYLELAARLKAIALDKTGTLTTGQPQVAKVIPLNGVSAQKLLEIAGAVGAMSQHPLAKAIAGDPSQQDRPPIPVTDFKSCPGRGVSGKIDDRRYWLESYTGLSQRGLATPELQAQFDHLSEDGSSLVTVSDDDRAIGLITLNDTIRPNAATSVAQLRDVGVEHIVMLTGDHARVGSRVCELVGVDDLRAELLPEEKVDVVKELVGQYQVAAMVGDGVNDAPAMALASFGIAMGHVGTDTALETADVVLMNDDLSRIPWMIRHSQRMRQIIRQNVVASLGVKAGFTVLTLMGHASLWSAILADTGMSLIVVANALRLLRPTPQQAAG